MVRASLLACALVLLTAQAQQVNPSTPKRVALVIGNSNYSLLPKLPSVTNDVTLISDVLGKAGFDVHRFDDFKTEDFPAAIRSDVSKFLAAGDVCVVYYAGYAVQGEDDNYLLPVNFDPQDQRDLQDRAYHFKKLQEILTAQGVALQIFIVEGPPAINVPVKGMQGAGLGDPAIDRSKETIFISAAQVGDWAPAASSGGVDLLTQSMAQAIGEQGIELGTLFDKVRRQVASSSGQNPYERSSVVVGQFYFHDPVVKPPPPTMPPPAWPRMHVVVQNRKDREEYLWIDPGKFMMGCVPGDKRCHDAEKPRHEVTLTKTKGFWMGRNEVQVDSYRRYVDANAKQKVKMPAGPLYDSHWKVGDHPIVNVGWGNAQAYCVWAGGRLPTEAEWEYAARGGVSDEIYPMNSEENSRDKANFAGKSGNDIYDVDSPEGPVAPVRKFDPNSYGLFDMAGNVWEWVSDWFAPYTAAPAIDPQGPPTGKDHLVRGGSWDSDPKEHLRISFRERKSKGENNIGFRCAIDDTPESRKQLKPPAQ